MGCLGSLNMWAFLALVCLLASRAVFEVDLRFPLAEEIKVTPRSESEHGIVGERSEERVEQVGWRAPIIIVPGLAASKLEVKLNRVGGQGGEGDENGPPKNCERVRDWSLTWMNANDLRKGRCFRDQMRLILEEEEVDVSKSSGQWSWIIRRIKGGKTEKKKRIRARNVPGVEVRPLQFGGLKGITSMLSLTSSGKWTIAVDKMSKLVGGIKEGGWRENSTLFGAPYDWRYAPTAGLKSSKKFYDDLTALVERAVRQTGHKSVLVGHSMGSLRITHFLSMKSKKWKNENVKAFISIAAPFGGSLQSVKSILLGDTGGIPFIPDDFFHEIQKTSTSGLWLTPRRQTFGDEQVVLSTPTKNYTVGDVAEALRDGGLHDQATLLEEVLGLDVWKNVKSLGVETICLYSTNVRTFAGVTLDFDLKSINSSAISKPKVSYNYEGDGLVNEKSLRECEHFADQVKTFDGVGHRHILANKEVLDIILSTATISAKGQVANQQR